MPAPQPNASGDSRYKKLESMGRLISPAVSFWQSMISLFFTLTEEDITVPRQPACRARFEQVDFAGAGTGGEPQERFEPSRLRGVSWVATVTMYGYSPA